MNSSDAFNLIDNDLIPRKKAITDWADLGCGTGLFTQALSRMLQPGSRIYGIDQQRSLKQQTTPNGIGIIPLQLDFVNDDWGLRDLDGIVMANSLHYVKDQPAFLRQLDSALLPAATLLLVEYDISRPIPTWVPYPVPFAALSTLLKKTGWFHIQKLGQRPSAYGRGNMYAALASRK